MGRTVHFVLSNWKELVVCSLLSQHGLKSYKFSLITLSLGVGEEQGDWKTNVHWLLLQIDYKEMLDCLRVWFYPTWLSSWIFCSLGLFWIIFQLMGSLCHGHTDFLYALVTSSSLCLWCTTFPLNIWVSFLQGSLCRTTSIHKPLPSPKPFLSSWIICYLYLSPHT